MPDLNNPPSDKISLSAEIVAAYVSHNSVIPGGLPALIELVHAALSNLGAVTVTSEPEPLVPAVSVRKSIKPEYLICLDDGKKFKSLKRHLGSSGPNARAISDQVGSSQGLSDGRTCICCQKVGAC